MIKYEEMKKAVNDAKKEEFEKSLISGSKRRFPGMNRYSTREIIAEYNLIKDLKGDSAYIWESLGKCFSLGDLRDSIRKDIPEYTPVLFDAAIRDLAVSDFDLPSAYLIISNYIEKRA